MPIYFTQYSPRLALWQTRLRQVPRWTWILIILLVVVPAAILLAGVAAIAIGAALVIALLAVAVLRIKNALRRLSAGPDRRLSTTRAAAERKNVRIVVERVDQRFV